MVMIGKKYQLTEWQESTRFEMCFSNTICECNKQTMIYITLDHIVVMPKPLYYVANAILFSVEKGSA